MALLLLLGAAADPCAKLTGVDLWLCTIRFNLPHIHIDQGSGLSHFELDITGLSCNGARIGSFNTVAKPHAGGGKSPTLSLELSGIALSCQAPTVQFEKPIKLNTHMTVGIDKVDVSTTLQLNLDETSVCLYQGGRGRQRLRFEETACDPPSASRPHKLT